MPEIKSRCIKEYARKEVKNAVTSIRITEYDIDGKLYRVFEKREFYKYQGLERPGKAKGFNQGDWLEIAPLVTEIGELLFVPGKNKKNDNPKAPAKKREGIPWG